MDNATDQLTQQISSIDSQIKEAQELLNDPEMKDLVASEITQLEAQKEALKDSIAAINGDFSEDESNELPFNSNAATIEIRQGAGGDEAKNWADDLLRMYMRFFEGNKCKFESLDTGYYKVTGKNVYNLIKYESGVHRVQRVPSTESSGRIHTSTASVAVLPIIKHNAVEIRDEDLEWQFIRASGAGGQSVNKTSSAVRLTHTPSGLSVSSSRERKQVQNRAIALEMLRSQLWEIEEERRLGSIEAQRKAAVGRASRAEKIRTFNFPQNRVTDHRINKSWYNLDGILEGDILKLLESVSEEMNKEV